MMGNFEVKFFKPAHLLIAPVLALLVAVVPGFGQPLVRQPNTTLQMPPTPPLFGFDVVDAWPGMSFTYPIAMASPPGETNRLFVAEQTGRIYIISNLANPTKTLFLDISAKVTGGEPAQEQGLLGFTFHPGYATNGYLYVLYNSSEAGNQGNGFYNRLSRFQVSSNDPSFAPSSSELPLLAQFDRSSAHNANDVKFGPDGYLYVAVGDEGNQNDENGNSQHIDGGFFGGILRLDVDKNPGNLPPNPHPASTTNYLVPADNPYVGATSFNGQPVNPGQVRTELYAVGLRNPWRMSFDPVTGELFSGDVGQGAFEEVDKITKGANYGWAYIEGNSPGVRAGEMPTNVTLTPPLLAYPHGIGAYEGGAVIGGMVYRGDNLAQLYGSYIFADYISGSIWKLSLSGTNVTEWTALANDTGISSFAPDPRNGDILMTDIIEGKIKRLVYNSTPVGPPLPPTLADTGVFSNLTTLQAYPGIVPYGLTLPFWSDNAIKSRWFSVPDTNLTMGFNADTTWSFPTGTVWIKHFDLEMTNGVPSSRRRHETRIIVKNAGGVYGVSYKWDASQTNATLVPEGGLTQDYVINDGGGLLRTQRWTFPSRSQCLACHTPVVGGAPGFNTRQLNREYDYGGTLTNQLRAFAQAGYFTTPPTNYAALGVLAHYTNTAFSLEYRFRSYLQANCAQCHQPGGSGRGQWDARITVPMSQANLLNGLLAEDLGNPTNRVIKPGLPAHSMLLTRISQNGALRMPPLGSSVLDTNAIALVRDYIRSSMRILPLGDSITDGYGGQNSYRRPLWQMLTNAGYTIDFVGTQTNNNGATPPNPDFDLDNEGHTGFTAGDILASLPTWLTNASNDIVLLHIGTNDKLNGLSDQNTTNKISQIIDTLRASNPKVAVLLAKLIPYDLPWTNSDGIPALNSNIATLATAKHTTQSPVILVDQYTGFDVSTDTFDSLHPDASGEQKMATNWFTALQPVLMGITNTPPIVTLTGPANGTTRIAPGYFTLLATAGDLDGMVTNVEFYAGATKIGERTNAPYQFDWTGVAVGSYAVRAVATDNAGARSTSAVANITVSPVPSYLRGINLGGDAVVIDGRTWLSMDAALASGFGTSGGQTTTSAGSLDLSPSTTPDGTNMLRSFIYRAPANNGEGFTLTQSVTNGAYQVWLWVVENYESNFRDMDVFVEGTQVASNIGSLNLGHWALCGPYIAGVSDGTLTVEVRRATKGEPSVSGILIGSLLAATNSGPPTITVNSNQTILEDTSTAALPFSISDPDEPAAALALTVASSNPSLIPTDNILLDGSGSNRTVTVTPAANANGSGDVSVIVSDGFGLKATNRFTVTVQPVPDAPLVSLATPTNNTFLIVAATNVTTNLSIQASASDPDGGTLTVELFRGVTLLATFTNAPYSFTFSNAGVGSYAFTAVATDSGGLKATSAVANVTIAVTPPFFLGINLGGASTIVEGHSWQSWDEAMSNGLTHANASWSSSSYGALTPNPDAGTRTMIESRVYALNPPDQTGFSLAQPLPNGSYQVFVWAVEDFQDNYRRLGLRLEGQTVTTNIGQLALFNWQKYGPYTVTVADGVLNLDVFRSGAGDPQLCGLVIQTAQSVASNTPPTITAITNRTIVEDTSTGPIGFTIGDAESSPAQLALSATSSATNLLPVTNIVFGGSGSNRTVTITPALNQVGASTVGIILTDPQGASATNSFTVTVLATNDPPSVAVVQPADNSFFPAGGSIPVQVTATDVDGTVTNVTLLLNGTPFASWTNAPYTLTWSNVAIGAYTLAAVATDNLGARATSVVAQVTVSSTPAFSLGVNLGGPATVVEGLTWLSWDAAQSNGLSPANASWFTGSFAFPLSPSPDAGTRTMLEGRALAFSPPDQTGFTLSQTITNGTYEVFVWAIEDFQDNFRRTGLRIEGVTVTTNIGELNVGAWQKYGPYTVTVADGVLDLEVFRSGKGDPMISGLFIRNAGPANSAPSVTLTNPASNAVFSLGVSISLGAAASDSETNLASVAFLDGATPLATLSNAPFTFVWTNASLGAHVLTAVATDSFGLAATSAVVNLTVTNLAPSVTLTNPSNNAVFTLGVPIALGANASDADGTIASVQFLANGVPLATDTGAPFSFTWTNAAEGAYALRAVATDGFGLAATSAVVNLTVSNAPPVVALTAPADSAKFPLYTTIALAAAASDPDGSVAEVKFYADGTLLGAGAGTNWALAWTNAPLGTFLLTAVAKDNWGRGATSLPVNLRIALVPRLRALPYSNAVIAIEVSGETNGLYRISSSPDLLQWTPVYTNTATNGVLLWPDPSEHATNRCFYRAEPLP